MLLVDLKAFITPEWSFLLFIFLPPLHQFVDLCILLGCDYCDKIAGLGPKRALTLIQKHRTIDNVVLHINRKVQYCQHMVFVLFSVCFFTKLYEVLISQVK